MTYETSPSNTMSVLASSQPLVKVVAETREIVAGREPFCGPVSLAKSDIFCGDKRKPINASGPYVHWFGAELNPIHTLIVMNEVTVPGSIADNMTTFESEARRLTPIIKEKVSPRIGVHSDTACEQGSQLQTNRLDGPVGCKYAEKRQPISALITQQGEEILNILDRVRPELFETGEDLDFGRKVLAAHGRLANRDRFYTSGRRVAIAAVEKGCKSQVLDSESAASDRPVGIINLDPSSSLDNESAVDAGQSAYFQDTALVMQAFGKFSDAYPYATHQLEIATEIDTIGTMLALGIDEKDIAVRRPA